MGTLTSNSELPEFENPPVIEVVCGILFEPLKAMLASHLGMLWERLRNEYPRCEEVAPLAPVIEGFASQPTFQFELTEVPPLPRVWFMREDETGLVQVQRDRFLNNWKKVRPADQYPRYHTVIRQFESHLTDFHRFVQDYDLGPILPKQYELTYVNHIPRGDRIQSLADLGRLFPDFAWQQRPERFLPSPNSMNWRTAIDLPDRKGRLHASIRSANQVSGTSMILFELTARGFPGDVSADSMRAWFDLGHEWIVRGFADLTGPEFHRDVWGRRR